MNVFIALAFSLSLAGAVAAPVGTILIKNYKEERQLILKGGSDSKQFPKS